MIVTAMLSMLIPSPVRQQSLPGVFLLTPQTVIAVQQEADRKTARLLSDAIMLQTGLRLSVTKRASKAPAIRLVRDNSVVGKEAYRLEATPEAVVVAASEAAGLFYGTQTLRQLVGVRQGAAEIAGTLIEDAPRYSWRGFMLDASRHFQKVETVKRILDQMALLKLNTLHWHLTDDQGWRLEIKRYPKLAQVTQARLQDESGGPGYYTHAQVRDIVRYAADRHINIVPEIEIPAHTTAAMAAYPELTCTGAEVPITSIGLHTFVASTGSRIYCAAKPECLKFIDGVIDEVVSLFPSPVIHVGGDERPEGIWSECPRCREVMEREKLPSEAALQRWFMGKVAAIVRSKGRRSMAWTPTVEFGVPEGEVVQDWFYGVLPDAVKLGADVVSSRDRFTYFDYPNFPGRQKPDWMPDMSIEQVYQFEPTPDGLVTDRVLGGECSLWTEFIEEEDINEAIFPRMLAFTETLWSPKGPRDFDNLKGRLTALEPLVKATGGEYARPDRPVKTVRPAKVETTMPADGPYLPECAFDGKFVRSYWSQSPPKSGDSLTVWLDEPVTTGTLRVYTGSDIAPDDVLENGFVEVSTDGETFRAVARIRGQVTKAKFLSRSIRAIRVSVAADMTHRLAIREIVVG